MVAVDNDDLIIDDEVEKSTPFRMDFDQHWRDLDHAHRSGHGRSNSDLEVDAIDPWCIAALQYGFAYPGLLLGRQCCASRTLGAFAFLSVGALALLSVIATTLLTLGALSLALAFGALAGLAFRFGLLALSAATLAIGATLLLALLLLLLLNLLFAFGPLSLLRLRRALLVSIVAALALLRRLLSLLSFSLLLLSRCSATFRSRTLLLNSLRCSKNRSRQQNGCCRRQN